MNKNDNKSKFSSSCWQRKKKDSIENIDEEHELLNMDRYQESDNDKSSKKKKKKQDEEIKKDQSFASMLSSQSEHNIDSKLLEYINNHIYIQDTNNLTLNIQGSDYMIYVFDKDENNSITGLKEQFRNLPKFMSIVWKLKNPKIIIPIITGVTNFKNWKNRKLEDQFKRGIIKTASKTECWFMTNGVNGGISQMVGDALSEELSNRSAERCKKAGTRNDSEFDLKPLVLIGIVDSSKLNDFKSQYDGENVYIRANGNKQTGKNFSFDLNADHTHFIIYNDEKNTNEVMNYSLFRDRLELLFTKSLSHWKRNSTKNKTFSRMTSINSGDTSDDDAETANPKAHNRQIPIVSLTIRGDLSSIDAVEYKIKKEIPVVVLKGSGGASDIIAFAFEEMSENKDPDYEESYLRPEISKKLNDEFKDEFSNNDLLRNKYRDKILTIVKKAIKGTQKFLTLVDMKGLTFDFQDLDKYILTALLQSQTQLSGKSGQAQLDRNLRLTLDWNREDLALSEIFQRDDFKIIEIKHGIFENAILRLDREQFVELFLDQGFCIHRYLGRNNLRDLFEKTEKRDFFVQVILQGMLGHFTSALPEDFFPNGLNFVLKKLTSIANMFSIMELYMNQVGLYVTDARQAEKKALNFLIIYAVLMNRHKLAKMLWKRSEDPIPVALVCSLIYKNLLPYCQENYIRSQIEKNQADFAECAVGVLDASFTENDPRSYSVLQEKYSDWNESTALELAYNSKNRNFIAHPCCQKMLTKRLFGHIQVREYNTDFLIHLPSWVKVTLSAILLLPMFFWIIFPVEEKRLNSPDETNDEDEEYDKDEEKEEEEMTKKELNTKYKTKNKKSIGSHKANGEIKKDDPEKGVELKERSVKKSQFYSQPFYKKIYFLWTSPYTKFWINFLSYIGFLILFGIVTLWPACGNLFLDSILWIWAATITFEDTRVAFHKHFTGSQLPLGSQIVEFILMVLFLIIFLIVRVLGTWSRFNIDFSIIGIDRVYFSKVFLAIFLLYYFYRTVFIFLPISHKLGPMLVRMKLMIKHDFTTYLRLFLIFMTAGAIALNAVLYPYYPFNFELMKRVILYRGFMTLFASDKQDLERVTDSCRSSNLSSRANQSYTCVDLVDNSYFKYGEKLREYNISGECNYQSTVAWMILIQYFLLVKLFLPSLLTAMFSATGQRISAQSEQLWMFQRYEIVLDYEIRSTFPPPFTLFCYIYMIIEWLWHLKTCCLKRIKIDCKRCCKKNVDKEIKQQEKQEKRLMNVQHYWRNFAQSYAKESEKEDKEKQKQKFLETSLNKVREDLTSQKKSLQRLNDRVISLEKSFIQNQSYLETIKNLMTQKTLKSTLFDRQKRNFIHILSRESPYITTSISRCFVSEKYVPWECAHDLYDPQFLSISHEVLKVEKVFVDDEPNSKLTENLAAPPVNKDVKIHFDLTNLNDQAQPLSSNDVTKTGGSQLSLSQAKQNIFVWNAVVSVDLSDGRTIAVDRKSWIFKIEERIPLIYSLDQAGLPRNPMGRTGIRGRGALYRYGPNHEIMAIVTRSKKYKNKIIYVDRKKLLEFIACKDLTSQMKIPGDKVIGDESKFSVVCRTFIELVFEESSVERGANFTEKDMTTFFASFASNKSISWNLNASNELLTSQFNDLGFFATMIYSGYIDDPRNTDNAWVEAEIWNFHYDKDEYFDKRIKNPLSKWREVSSNVRIHSNDIIVDVLKEVAEKHNAFYN